MFLGDLCLDGLRPLFTLHIAPAGVSIAVTTVHFLKRLGICANLPHATSQLAGALQVLFTSSKFAVYKKQRARVNAV